MVFNLTSRPNPIMRLLSGLVILFAIAAIPTPSSTLPPAAAQAPLQKGMAFATSSQGGFVAPGVGESLAQLKDTGADWISLIVTGVMSDHVSSTIDLSGPTTVPDDELAQVIQAAHDLGLKIMLKPQIDLKNDGDGHWRGEVGAQFTTENQWNSWFSSYRDFIKHYAQLAAANAVEELSIGAELIGTTHRDDDWRGVISEVRSVFKGPLTYASLAGGEETAITWWDALDYIGVNAYYRLSSPDQPPTLAGLKAGWGPAIQTLSGLSTQYEKPVLLTELGQRSQSSCGQYPKSADCEPGIDLTVQSTYFQAAYESLKDQAWLAGVYWYFWSPNLLNAGPCDTGFSPSGKPAEAVVRAWYGAGPPRPPAPPIETDYTKTMDLFLEGLSPEWEDWSWNATVNPKSTKQAHAGKQAMSVVLQPRGALSLVRKSTSPAPYTWLEFYVRADGPSPVLEVFLQDDQNNDLQKVALDTCRYVDGGPIDGTWRRVRIPLIDLDRENVPFSRINVQNRNQKAPTAFSMDDIRLIAAAQTLAATEAVTGTQSPLK